MIGSSTASTISSTTAPIATMSRGSSSVAAAIERNHALAQALNINGTPAFVIGDAAVPGAVSMDDLKSLIKAARGS